MANQSSIIQKIITHLLTKKWTKQNFIALAGIVLVACVGKYTGIDLNKSTTSTTSSTSAKKGSTYSAKVVKVADGDTATVVDNHGATHKIRFAYIDAPEKAQAHGIASKDALTKLIDGKTVQVYVTDVDRYQREVGVVSVNGLDVNYEQVKNGNAWHYQTYAKKNQPASEFSKYNTAWQNAQKQRIGLWDGKTPQAPWDYRAQKRASEN